METDKKIDLLDPEFWSREWKQAAGESSLHRITVDEKSWIELWSSISLSYRLRTLNEQKMIDEVIGLLIKEGLIHRESVVLDIGSGPGTLALPLARLVSYVFALDPASKMLDALTEEARGKGLSNIIPLCKRWQETSFEREFDLVLASFSPAIRSVEDLLKMERASRRYCCLITASGAENFKMRNELWEKIFGRPFYSTAFHVTFPFNYLYARGLRPNLRFIKQSICYEEPLETLIDWYENYFKMFVDLNDSNKKIIRQYFKDKANGSLVKVRDERTFSIMCWEVEK